MDRFKKTIIVVALVALQVSGFPLLEGARDTEGTAPSLASRAIAALLGSRPAAATEAAGPVELVEERGRDTKVFANPDGSRTAVFGKHLNYLAAPGDWRPVDLTFRRVGDNDMLDRSGRLVTVDTAGVKVVDRASGKGVRWITPVRPDVAGRVASFVGQHGLTWVYHARPDGVKLTSTVSSGVGLRLYAFPYDLVGGAGPLIPAADGSLANGSFTLPPPIVEGADGLAHPVGAWQILGPNSIGFTLDDSSYPAQAFPYEIDPTTRFEIDESVDDGFAHGQGATWSGLAYTVLNTDATYFRTSKKYEWTQYNLDNGIVRWYTQPIPDNATITDARLKAYVAEVNDDHGGRNMLAEWYTGGFDSGAWTTTSSSTASGSPGWDLTTMGTGVKTWTLTGLSSVSKTGTSGLRFHLTGGAPAVNEMNEVRLGSWDSVSTSVIPPTLEVDYTLPTVIAAAESWTASYGAEELAVADHAAQVALPSGRLSIDVEDLSLPARGFDVGFGRTYHSANAGTASDYGTLGPGWTHSFDEWLVEETDGDVVWFDGGQHQRTFTKSGATTYTSPAGIYETITKQSSGWTLRGTDHTTKTFDADGWLTGVVDDNGNLLAVARDAETGRVTYVCTATPCSATNDSLAFTYTAVGGALRLNLVTDRAGRVWDYGYDASGRLTTVKDDLNNITTYSYGTGARLASITDAETGRAEVTYDASARVVSLKDARAVADAAGKATTLSYGTGVTTVYSAEANDRTPQGAATAYTYDASGRLTQLIDPLARKSTFTYDSNHNVLTEVSPLGYVSPNTALQYTTTYTYDARGNRLTETDPLGSVTTGDPNDHKVSYEFNATNDRTKMTDQRGKITTYDYGTDGKGNLAVETDPLENKTTYTYAANGDRLTETEPRGNVAGLPAADKPLYTTTYAYDGNGQVLTEKRRDPTNIRDITTTNTYDSFGNQRTVTDPLTHVTTTEHDALGRVVWTTDPLGAKTSFTYDKTGRQVTEIAPEGNVSGATQAMIDKYTSKTDYLKDGSVLREIESLEAPTIDTEHEYDWNGNETAVIDPRLNRTETTFDLADQLDLTTEPGGTTTDTDYFADGLVKKVTDPTGLVTESEYDAAGRMTATVGPRAATDGTKYRVTQTYDDAGNQLAEVSARGNLLAPAQQAPYTTTNTYDDAGRLKTVTDAAGTTTYGYDEAGNRKQITDPAGTVTTFAFDNLGRQTQESREATASTTTTDSVDQAGVQTRDHIFTTTKAGTISAAATWDPGLSGRSSPVYTGSLATGASATESLGSVPPSSSAGASVTYAKGPTTTSVSFSGSSAPGSTIHDLPVTESSALPITASVTWGTYQRTDQSWGGSVNDSVTSPDYIYRDFVVGAPGPLQATMTWRNSQDLLTASTHLRLRLYNPAGTMVASDEDGAQYAFVSYTAPTSGTYPATYRLGIRSSDLAATYTITGKSQVYPDVDIELLNASGAVVASDLGGNTSASLTYASPPVGLYRLRVKVNTWTASYSASVTYPVLGYAAVRFEILGPTGAVVSTQTGYAGSVYGSFTTGATGGTYSMRVTDVDAAITVPSYQMGGSFQSAHAPWNTLTGTSLAPGEEATFPVWADGGAGNLSGYASWTDGYKGTEQTFNGSVGVANADYTQTVNVTSTALPVTGALTWTDGIRDSDPAINDSVAALGTKEHPFSVSYAGTFTARLGWSGTLNKLRLQLVTPSGSICATSAVTDASPVTLSCAVTSGTLGQYKARVISDTAANAVPYTISNISYPVLADLDLALVAPNGSEVAASRTTSEPETISFQPTVTGVHTFKIRSIDTYPAPYTLKVTHGITAHADVRVSIYDGNGVHKITSSAGTNASAAVSVGTADERFIFHVRNIATDGVSAPSFTMNVSGQPVAREKDLDIKLLSAAGAEVGTASDHDLRPESVLYAAAPAGTYTVRVTAKWGAPAYTLTTAAPTTETITSAYDDANRKLTETDSAGVTAFTYDIADRIDKVDLPGGVADEYDIDHGVSGQREKAAAPAGTRTFTYDRGRLATEAFTGDATTTYGYDSTGNEDSVTRSGSTFRYGWDTRDRLASRYVGTNPATTFTPGEYGRTQVAHPTGGSGTTDDAVDTTTFTAGLPAVQRVRPSTTGTPIADLAYTHDPDGNITAVADTSGADLHDQTFTYDSIQRLASESVRTPTGTERLAYTYDAVGSRATQTSAGLVSTFARNPAGQVVSRTDPGGPVTTYAYDARGNLVAKHADAGATIYTWTPDDRLATVDPPGDNNTSTYTYDADGDRIVSTGVQSSQYAYAGGGRVVAKTLTGVVYPFTYDADGRPLMITSGGSDYVYRYDAGGNVVALTKSSDHTVAARYVYDAWGNAVSVVGDAALLAANPYRYRGAYQVRWEAPVGLYLMRARWYDPTIGRFISRDPAEAERSSSTYSYAANGPMNRLDPTGLAPQTSEEWAVCLAEWYDCSRSKPADDEADRYAQREYPKGTYYTYKGPKYKKLGRRKITKHNDIYDAMRHCLWSAFMTKRANEGFAKRMADAHEYGNDDQPSDEREMDLHNNRWGRKAGLEGERKSNEFIVNRCGSWAEASSKHPGGNPRLIVWTAGDGETYNDRHRQPY